MVKRIVGEHKRELVIKAREAAISAIQTFNSPQIMFKSETFIVLIIIAWTYAFHSIYKGKVGLFYKRDGALILTIRQVPKMLSLEDC